MHRCRNRQIFGSVKDFCPNFPKLAGKMFKKNDLKKTTKTAFSFVHFKHHFFPNCIQTCPAQISPNLPKITTVNTLKNMISPQKKKRPHLDFGCRFCKIKAHAAVLQRFSHILPNFHRFSRILRDFAWIFTRSKVLRVRLHPLHPRLLHQWPCDSASSNAVVQSSILCVFIDLSYVLCLNYGLCLKYALWNISWNKQIKHNKIIPRKQNISSHVQKNLKNYT